MLTRRQYNRKSIGKTEKSASSPICPIGRVGDVPTLLKIKLFLKKDKYMALRVYACHKVGPDRGGVLEKWQKRGPKKVKSLKSHSTFRLKVLAY